MNEIRDELEKIENSEVFKDELREFAGKIQNAHFHISNDNAFLSFLELVLDRCRKAKEEEE